MRRRSLRGRDERGIALILVIWVFMVLGVLALDFAQYIRDDAMAAVNFSEETHGYYIALAGMNRAIFDAEQVRERGGGDLVGEEAAQEIPADGRWHEGDFAGGRYSVRMTDEGGRISLNRIEEALLNRIVNNLVQGGESMQGVDRRTANDISTIVSSILDWRDADNLERLHGAENKYYLALRTPYRAKNGFFDSPEELMLVKGVTRQLFEGGNGMPGMRDVFSVYNRRTKLNVRTAPAAVLQVLLATTVEDANILVEDRTAGDIASFMPRLQGQVAAVDPQLAELLSDEPAHTVTIEARADVRQPRNQSRVAAVVDLSNESAEGTRVLRWLDRAPPEFETPAVDAEGGA